MNEWMNELMNKQMNELMNELTYIVNLILNWPAKAKKNALNWQYQLNIKFTSFEKPKSYL